MILATDGCFDNLWEGDLCRLVDDHRDSTAERTAEAIVERARFGSQQTSGHSPFAVSGHKHGFSIQGGKPDDITVICIRVQGTSLLQSTLRCMHLCG